MLPHSSHKLIRFAATIAQRFTPADYCVGYINQMLLALAENKNTVSKNVSTLFPR